MSIEAGPKLQEPWQAGYPAPPTATYIAYFPSDGKEATPSHGSARNHTLCHHHADVERA